MDSSPRPQITIWSDFAPDEEPVKQYSDVAASTVVHSISFFPESADQFVTTGQGHVSLWSMGGTDDEESSESGLVRKQGLFTRKIDRPKDVFCVTFAQSGEILTGDSDGNVMIWKMVKVIRVLKGAHTGAVGDICVLPDGSFVSGGLEDGALVIFNKEYQLIGAGAYLPKESGKVRRILVIKITF